MKRRSFLSFLAGLPLVGLVVPKPTVDPDKIEAAMRACSANEDFDVVGISYIPAGPFSELINKCGKTVGDSTMRPVLALVLLLCAGSASAIEPYYRPPVYRPNYYRPIVPAVTYPANAPRVPGLAAYRFCMGSW